MNGWQYFGDSVSVDGNSVIVGATKDDDQGINAGGAYVFVRTGSTWTQQQKLVAADGASSDDFGDAVSISGDSAVVGSWRDDDAGFNTGSAYIFSRSGTNWVQQKKLVASDADAGDFFGGSVSIDGDLVVVGSSQDDDNGDLSGSAYVYARSGTDWTEQQKLTAFDGAFVDRFGGSVSIAGESVVVGAPGDDDEGSGGGSAYVFTRSGSTWSLQQKVTAEDGPGGRALGISVSVSGDTVVAGAWKDNLDGPDSGSTYVFARSGSSWSQEQKLTAGSSAHDARFGHSVDVSGSSVVVGAPQQDLFGNVYVFNSSEGAWRQQARISLRDGEQSDPIGFGRSVSIDGDTLIAGANAPPAGGAYIFTRAGTNWAEQARILPSDGVHNDEFGASTAISGDTAVVGNRSPYVLLRGSPGTAYVFARSGTNWVQQAELIASDSAMGDEFGASVSIFGDTIVVGAMGVVGPSGEVDAGSAYVFTRSGTNWNEQAKLVASDLHTSDLFGHSVSISGDSVIVGARLNDQNGDNSGASYVFTRTGTNWTQQQKLSPDDGFFSDQFGSAVSIDGDWVLVGARGDDNGKGSAYTFSRSGSVWSQQQKSD